MSSPDALTDAPKAVEFLSESELSNLRAEWDDKDRRNLYISVADYHGERGKVLYSVHRINLKDLLFNSDFEITRTEFSKDSLGACAGFGTGLDTIFLAGGFRAKFSEELVVPEPSTEILALSVADLRKVGWVPFLHGKVWPLIWEVGGRLYVLASNPPPTEFKYYDHRESSYEWKNCFEMYDRDKNRWVSLPDPPSFADPFAAADESDYGGGGQHDSFKRCDYYSEFSYAILGDQLFVSNPKHPENPSYRCLLSVDPVKWDVSSFRFEGVTLGVATGNGFVVFSYVRRDNRRRDKYEVIKVHLLMNGNDEPVHCQSLMMPALKYADEVMHSQFVDLGGQKVCFLYSTGGVYSKLFVTAITLSFKLEQRNGHFNIEAKICPPRSREFQNKAGLDAHVSAVQQVVGATIG